MWFFSQLLSRKTPKKEGAGGQKMKILALGANSTKFCIHNLWVTRRLEMQKLTTQNGEEDKKMKILPLGPNSTKFCTHNL